MSFAAVKSADWPSQKRLAPTFPATIRWSCRGREFAQRELPQQLSLRVVSQPVTMTAREWTARSGAMGFMFPDGRRREETPARAAGSSDIRLFPRPAADGDGERDRGEFAGAPHAANVSA